MKKLLYLTITLCALSSCKVKTPEIVDFALESREVMVSHYGGPAGVKVYSGGSVNVSVCQSVNWGTLISPPSFEGDGDITLEFDENAGMRRACSVAVSFNQGRQADTIIFKQAGEKAFLNLAEHNLFVKVGFQTEAILPISTNIPSEDMQTSITYSGGEGGWISSVSVGADKITVGINAGASENIRRAEVSLQYTDGWGEIFDETFFVILSNNAGEFGTKVDFQTVRQAGTQGVITLDKDWFIEGVVISDCASMNMELNENTAYNVVDTSMNNKTAYIESLDGKYGFRLKFVESEDNILHQKQKVNLQLNGLTLLKEENPERYTIGNIVAASLDVVEENVDIPLKEMSIASLQDSDVYTFVNLQNTEFLNKEGSFSNVFDSFTLPSDFNTTKVSSGMHGDGWACLLIDADGDAIYAMVNMLCSWRRNGTGVPLGVGAVKGIIVHNEQPRYGNLGRYQIRVVDNKGFAQSKTTGSSYEVFAKWDGKEYKYDFSKYGTWFPYVTTNNGMDTVIPSDDFSSSTGSHRAVLYFENKAGQPTSGTKAVRPCQSFDALKMSTNGGRVDKRALSIQCNISGWYNWKEDGSIDSYNGIVAEFSAVGLEGRKMYLYYAFCCGGSENIAFKNFPGRWCVEYSTDGGETYKLVNAVESGKEYIHLRAYPFGTVTIDGRQYYPSYSTGLGQTEHLYEFPGDILGKETVKVRIRPYDLTVTSLPSDPAGDIEMLEAYKGISVYQDLRINRINILTTK